MNSNETNVEEVEGLLSSPVTVGLRNTAVSSHASDCGCENESDACGGGDGSDSCED